MGAVLLLISVVLIAVGTWKWSEWRKSSHMHDRFWLIFWGGVALSGIILFFLLKIAEPITLS